MKPETMLIGVAALVSGALISQYWNKEEMNKLRKTLTTERHNAEETQQRLGYERDQYWCMIQMLRSSDYKSGYDNSKKLCSDVCWQVEYSQMRDLGLGQNMTPNKMYRKARDGCGGRGC